MLQILLQTQETSNRTLILILTNISLYLLHSLCRINVWSPNSSNYTPWFDWVICDFFAGEKYTKAQRKENTKAQRKGFSVPFFSQGLSSTVVCLINEQQFYNLIFRDQLLTSTRSNKVHCWVDVFPGRVNQKLGDLVWSVSAQLMTSFGQKCQVPVLE